MYLSKPAAGDRDSDNDNISDLVRLKASLVLKLLGLAFMGAAFAYWTYKNASDVPQMREEIKGLQTDMGWVKDSLTRIEGKLQ
jgi:hypothetical protein